jgi:hypothetical protein
VGKLFSWLYTCLLTEHQAWGACNLPLLHLLTPEFHECPAIAPGPLAELMQIDGVVATGLLMGVASAAVIASPSGPRVVELAVDKEAAAVMQAQQQQSS